MPEMLDILTLYHSLIEAGRAGVLASVVKTSGSTYRRAGARMLIADGRETAGLISGGCVDTDMRARSSSLLAGGPPVMVTYDSTSGDDILWGLGLGCTGIAEILLEHVSCEQPSAALEFIEQCRLRSCPGVIATVLRSEPSSPFSLYARVFLTADSYSSRGMDRGEPPAEFREACEEVLASGSSSHRSVQFAEGSADLFIEYLSTPQHLVVFGAGPDALPVVRLACDLGWNVSVIDAREAFLHRESFPGTVTLLAASPEEMVGRAGVTANSLALAMTHNFNHDCSVLKRLFETEARYIGLLGPRAKADLILEYLRKEGTEVTPRDLRRFHAPVGLDIGAESPEEIAHSVIAEMLAVVHGRRGEFLRDHPGPVHS
jgi:xanthine dehydrogenase accessory factor